MEYNSLLKLPSNDVFPDNRLYHMSEKTLKFSALHWHEYYEMEFVLSGHAVEIVNGVSYAIGPGTVTLLSPVDFHAYHELDPNNPLVLIKLQFQDLFLPKTIRNDIYMHKEAKITKINDEIFKNMLIQLFEEYQKDHYAKDTYLMNGIVNLCILMMRHVMADKKVDRLSEKEHSPIQDAVLYVRTHFRENISAEAVAKTVHLSPNYFSEYFKKQTGEKFSIFVLRLRVEFAANLLRVSDLSVKEVAFESGFNSAAYFSNTFKSFYNTSPERYRKENRIKLVNY